MLLHSLVKHYTIISRSEHIKRQIRCNNPDCDPVTFTIQNAIPWPTGTAEIQGIVAWFARGDDYLAVCLKSTGKLIGFEIDVATRLAADMGVKVAFQSAGEEGPGGAPVVVVPRGAVRTDGSTPSSSSILSQTSWRSRSSLGDDLSGRGS